MVQKQVPRRPASLLCGWLTAYGGGIAASDTARRQRARRGPARGAAKMPVVINAAISRNERAVKMTATIDPAHVVPEA